VYEQVVSDVARCPRIESRNVASISGWFYIRTAGNLTSRYLLCSLLCRRRFIPLH